MYLRLLISLLAILIPACASSSPAFLMMYSAYELNKQRVKRFANTCGKGRKGKKGKRKGGKEAWKEGTD